MNLKGFVQSLILIRRLLLLGAIDNLSFMALLPLFLRCPNQDITSFLLGLLHSSWRGCLDISSKDLHSFLLSLRGASESLS